MSDIFQEVDEALKQEKLEKFWQDHGPKIVAAIIVLILGVAGFSGYSAWNKNKNETRTAQVLEHLNADNPAVDLIENIETTPQSHQAFVLLNAAGLQTDSENYAVAANLYKQVFENKNNPKDLQNLARIYYVTTIQKVSNTDIKTVDLLEVLEPITQDSKNTWHWVSKIYAASIAGNLQEDYKSALTFLENFETQTNIPQSLKDRAISLQKFYTYKLQNMPQETQQDS